MVAMEIKINLFEFVGAVVSVWWLVLLPRSSGTFISGEEAIGSPLRVAQCRAQCLQTVSTERIHTAVPEVHHVYLDPCSICARRQITLSGSRRFHLLCVD
jgi:hypothetical protein